MLEPGLKEGLVLVSKNKICKHISKIKAFKKNKRHSLFQIAFSIRLMLKKIQSSVASRNFKATLPKATHA